MEFCFEFKGMGVLSSGYSVKMTLFLFEKGSTLKGKNLLPGGANSFLLELTPIRKGLNVQEDKQEDNKICLPYEKRQLNLHLYPFY